MGQESGLQFRHEILQGMDILQIIAAVVSKRLKYSKEIAPRPAVSTRCLYGGALIFQGKVDTSLLQQSETGSVADRVHGRPKLSRSV